jgi:hypothetical protein
MIIERNRWRPLTRDQQPDEGRFVDWWRWVNAPGFPDESGSTVVYVRWLNCEARLMRPDLGHEGWAVVRAGSETVGTWNPQRPPVDDPPPLPSPYGDAERYVWWRPAGETT